MNQGNSNLELQQFFPANLLVEKVEHTDDTVYIYLRTVTEKIICPHCGSEMRKHHTLHRRTVQDLPILNKRTYLKITACDFKCENPSCPCVSKSETFEGFLSDKSRMTERLIEWVIELALNTSCEGAARILNAMNVKICGDTVIHTLIRRYQKQTVPKSGSCIGVDDFALKKGQTYATIVVDEETHTPLAILDGRDGKTLKEWLKQNQHVTAITRDRASAYANAIKEILPEAMQIADRFHLYQNLMEAVKTIIKQEIQEEKAQEKESDSKKNALCCGQHKAKRTE